MQFYCPHFCHMTCNICHFQVNLKLTCPILCLPPRIAIKFWSLGVPGVAIPVLFCDKMQITQKRVTWHRRSVTKWRSPESHNMTVNCDFFTTFLTLTICDEYNITVMWRRLAYWSFNYVTNEEDEGVVKVWQWLTGRRRWVSKLWRHILNIKIVR